MGLLDRHVFPRLNDLLLGRAFEGLRSELLAGAEGRVLEIGSGTGLNFAHYGASVEVTAVEPSDFREAPRARARKKEAKARVSVAHGKAEALPFDAGSFDCVVSTFVLCSVRSVEASLAEARRVLKPGGRLLLLEHVRSRDPGVARWQERLRPVWMTVFGGCDPTRQLGPALHAAGFDPDGVEAIDLPLPRLARDGVMGVALTKPR